MLVGFCGQPKELAGSLCGRGLVLARGSEAQQLLEVGAQADGAQHVDEHHGAVRWVCSRQVPVCYVLPQYSVWIQYEVKDVCSEITRKESSK